MSRRSRAGNRPPHHRPACHPRREHDRPSNGGRPPPSASSPISAPGSSSPAADETPVEAAREPVRPPKDRAPLGSGGLSAGPDSNGSGVAAPTAPTVAEAHVPAGERRSAESQGSCTAPQLRRFIKSRAYVPMHELRRRFAIDGAEDDMALIEVDGGQLFVGLPKREGALLGELLRAGEVGYELSLDPRTPVVVGLFPMRPIPRG